MLVNLSDNFHSSAFLFIVIKFKLFCDNCLRCFSCVGHTNFLSDPVNLSELFGYCKRCFQALDFSLKYTFDGFWPVA